jgi:hypothetical protein
MISSNNLKERDNLRDLYVDKRMILKWILKDKSVRMWLDLGVSGSGQGLVAGLCEHGNGPFSSMKGESLLASQEGLCSMELVHNFVNDFLVPSPMIADIAQRTTG